MSDSDTDPADHTDSSVIVAPGMSYSAAIRIHDDTPILLEDAVSPTSQDSPATSERTFDYSDSSDIPSTAPSRRDYEPGGWSPMSSRSHEPIGFTDDEEQASTPLLVGNPEQATIPVNTDVPERVTTPPAAQVSPYVANTWGKRPGRFCIKAIDHDMFDLFHEALVRAEAHAEQLTRSWEEVDRSRSDEGIFLLRNKSNKEAQLSVHVRERVEEDESEERDPEDRESEEPQFEEPQFQEHDSNGPQE